MQLDHEETVTFRPGQVGTSTGAASAPNAGASFSDAGVTEEPPQLPTDGKGYYACRNCRRILVEAQWYKEGCLGCRTGPVHRGELMEYATPHFTNFFGLIDPSRSWVARLIGKGGLMPDGTEVPNAIYAEALEDEELDEESEEEDDDGDVDAEETHRTATATDAAATGDGHLESDTYNAELGF